MLYDLNVAWSEKSLRPELERTLRFARSLGYDVVALNHAVTTPPSVVHGTSINNPIPGDIPSSTPQAAHVSHMRTTTSSTTKKHNAAPTPALKPPSAPIMTAPTSSYPILLRRVTITITDPAREHYNITAHTRAYDLIALRPTNESAFKWCCSQDQACIVSLDMAFPLPWHLHPRTCMAAAARGIFFEVCYSHVLASSPSSGNRPRANFVGNLRSLVLATKGRGVIVSSGASSALGLRPPADVVNLLAVWGLLPERGKLGMGESARTLVANEGIRRRGFSGVVDILRVAPALGSSRGDGEKRLPPPPVSKKQQKREAAARRKPQLPITGQDEQDQQRPSRKRKGVELDEVDETGAGRKPDQKSRKGGKEQMVDGELEKR